MNPWRIPVLALNLPLLKCSHGLALNEAAEGPTRRVLRERTRISPSALAVHAHKESVLARTARDPVSFRRAGQLFGFFFDQSARARRKPRPPLRAVCMSVSRVADAQWQVAFPVQRRPALSSNSTAARFVKTKIGAAVAATAAARWKGRHARGVPFHDDPALAALAAIPGRVAGVARVTVDRPQEVPRVFVELSPRLRSDEPVRVGQQVAILVGRQVPEHVVVVQPGDAQSDLPFSGARSSQRCSRAGCYLARRGVVAPTPMSAPAHTSKAKIRLCLNSHSSLPSQGPS